MSGPLNLETRKKRKKKIEYFKNEKRFLEEIFHNFLNAFLGKIKIIEDASFKFEYSDLY